MIGYIRFNDFLTPVDQRFPEALESLRGTRLFYSSFSSP
jgi:hypothetical protein